MRSTDHTNNTKAAKTFQKQQQEERNDNTQIAIWNTKQRSNSRNELVGPKSIVRENEQKFPLL